MQILALRFKKNGQLRGDGVLHPQPNIVHLACVHIELKGTHIRRVAPLRIGQQIARPLHGEQALIGTQLGLKWLPVRGLRFALGVVLLIASGKLLLA